MEGIRYAIHVLHYRSIGKRRPERPQKRLLGYSCEAEAGHLFA